MSSIHIVHRPRYVYTKEPLTPEEAERIRNQHIEEARESVETCKAELLEAERELLAMQEKPAPTHRTIQTTLNYGDEGYDEAPVSMNVDDYVGDWKWVNTEAPKP